MIERKSYDHILLVTNDLNTDRRMHRICDALLDNGRSVLLIGRKREKSQKLIKRRFDQFRVNCWFNSGPLFYLEINIRFFFKLYNYNLKSITSNDSDTIIAGVLIKTFKKCHFYIDSHEYFSEVPELKNRPIKKWIWKKIARWGFKQSKHNYTVNKHLAQELQAKYKQEFQVIRNVPLGSGQVPDNRWDKQRLELVYLGVLNEGRGLLEIIETLPLLPNCFLKIIGDGVYKDRMIRHAADLEVAHQILFLGTLSDEEFKTHIKTASIGLNLLMSDSLSYYFSSANKFFDYLHCGIPVLTMNFPFYQDISKFYNVTQLVSDLEPMTLANAIKDFRKTFMAERFNEDLTKIIEVYNWEKEIDKLLAIYK